MRLAYEAAGNAILKVDPQALIFCEGISEYPDSAASGGYDTTWWGGDLQGVTQYPVTLSSPGHVVYSAHDYGPDLFQQTWFNASTTSASLDAVWSKYWGYIPQQGIAPLWVGEFGTDNTAAAVSSTVAGSQGQWFSSLVSYIQANNLSWTYWALNGEDAYALLDNGYDATPVLAAKQSLLATIQDPLPGAGTGTGTGTGTPTATPTPTPTPTPTGGSTSPSSSPTATSGSGGSCTATVTSQSSWSGGFVDDINVTAGSSGLTSWTVTFTWPGDEKVTSAWGASATQSGESVTVTSASYNGTVPAGTTLTNVGVQGTWTSSDALPTSVSCS